ncbi:glutaminyl-peptide cyclotransferase [Oceanimonas baumannii]|uniref:Glutaminyl-peptide cyclotransferase n=1 Tax=Oceanimonas baumannii TaxID=129578 RepID=A0A235CJJ1_9GAMM|nr:glutaminyl-peptide cyclotransferase [Oceanimonas baumannii]OYD24554.1 glutaminyl-peptide cyclotransferase [Oceanimonas baumannii]TDW59287.1 glutaminyl-peptide cyclotransferase [Oceanimonas baumannii]
MKPAGGMLWGLLLLLLAAQVRAVEQLAVEVMETLPHDVNAFTQGLEWHDGRLYESTGLYGQSGLRQLKAYNGEAERHLPLSATLFGEGLARVDNQLVQLTWKEGRALVWRLPGLKMETGFTYQGEGWGLCYDGRQLWMSDGSAHLQQRSKTDFVLQQRLTVRLHGQPQHRLNALACVGEHIYANVWKETYILRIQKDSGRVDAVIDASSLLPLSGRKRHPEAVLNGIAYRPDTGEFYLTGKWWSRLFKVRFVQVSGTDAAGEATAALKAR